MKTYIFLLVITSFTLSFGQDDFADAFSSIDDSSEHLGIELSGFVEFEQGININESSRNILANRRFRLQADKRFDDGGIFTKVDFLSDDIEKENALSLRELRFQKRLGKYFDLSVGRQVLTWGVGDLVFINDLFPKDWVALFTGQDMEMLKKPSNTLRLTSYLGAWTFDFAYTPKFTPDRTPNGCRFAIFEPNSRSNTLIPGNCGNDSESLKNSDLSHGELAFSTRVEHNGLDLGFYAYRGFYKSPKGLMTQGSNLIPYYPKLSVYGASLESPFASGIISAEVGYYDSREDSKGDNFLVENSSFKYLLGYRQEISSSFSYGLQIYSEIMDQYSAYKKAYLANAPSLYKYKQNRTRNTYTLRLTYKTQQDTLFLSLFTYYRPEDRDSFIKFEIAKDLTDQFKIVAGVNLFQGKENYLDREFGMLKNSDNAYLRMRYSF